MGNRLSPAMIVKLREMLEEGVSMPRLSHYVALVEVSELCFSS